MPSTEEWIKAHTEALAGLKGEVRAALEADIEHLKSLLSGDTSADPAEEQAIPAPVENTAAAPAPEQA